MHLMNIGECQRALEERPPAGLRSFTIPALAELLVPTLDGRVFTLLKSQISASLVPEGDALILTASGQKYVYTLRVLTNCVHATVRRHSVSRIEANACLSTTKALEDMFETIVCDAES